MYYIKKTKKKPLFDKTIIYPKDLEKEEKKTKKSRPKAKRKVNLVDKLDKIFSLYIRLRDSKQYGYRYFRCISCGKLKPFEQADCGHFWSRRHMNTRYDELNCHSECSACNRFSADHLIDYRTNLIRKIGQRKYDLLEWKKEQTKKWSDFELEQMIKYYTVLVNEMKHERN